MIIDTLTKRRNEIASQIRELTDNLTHLDATIKLFAPEYSKPRLQRGDVTRRIFNVIRNAGKPMNTREVAAEALISTHRAGIVLNAQAKKGLVKSARGKDGRNLWEVAG